MGTRGRQKHPEQIVDEKEEACSSSNFRPSSSNSSVQTHMNSSQSNQEAHDDHMGASSSASAPIQLKGDLENDSTNESCSSNDMEQNRGSLECYRNVEKQIEYMVSCLSEQADPKKQLAALTRLCEVLLSFPRTQERSLRSHSLRLFSPPLVKLVKHETAPEVMLLAVRNITYLCNASPHSAADVLVSNDAAPTLCQRLLTTEYLDLAEQCLRALEKISQKQPRACMQAGAIMAVLKYIDFFSTSIKRVAVSTIVNMCHLEIYSASPSLFMEAVPILCDLLQHEDQQLVDGCAFCLTAIGNVVAKSSEMLDELCKHGLIEQVTHLLSLNGHTTNLTQRPYTGLIWLLRILCSGSVVAFRTLHELNIGSIFTDKLSAFYLHLLSSYDIIGGYNHEAFEVLKLLNALLPAITKDQDDPLLLDKESFLAYRPDLIRKLGIDVLPLLIQVFNVGESHAHYGCVSVIYKLVYYYSKCDMCVELHNDTRISSFLAKALTSNDCHPLILALQITELILQKFSDKFLELFVMDGVFFAIGELISSERYAQFGPREGLKCPCYAFSCGQPSTSSKNIRICKLDRDSVYHLSRHIKAKYSPPELTNILQNLISLSDQLNDLLSMSIDNCAHSLHEEKINSILHQIVDIVAGNEQVSAFEIMESEIVKALVNYLSNGQYMWKNRVVQDVYGYDAVIEKRFEALAKVLLSASKPLSGDTPLSLLIRNLQSALAYLPNFTVNLSHLHGPIHSCSFANVPNECFIPYPCLQVRFIKDKGEAYLDNYENFLTVDPLSSLHAIEGYLRPKVSVKNTKQVRSSSIQVGLPAESPTLHLQSNASLCSEESPFFVEPDFTTTHICGIQVDEPKLSQPRPEQAINMGVVESSFSETQVGYAEQEQQWMAEVERKLERLNCASCSDEAAQKLVFYLEGQQLDHNLSLYQAIHCQMIKRNKYFSVGEPWNQVYTLTFRRATKSKDIIPPPDHLCSPQDLSIFDEVAAYYQHTPFFSDMFSCELVSDLNKSSRTSEILFLLKALEGLNRFIFHLMSRERICAFAVGKVDNLDNLKIAVSSVTQNEFVSNQLTEMLEQQMRDPLAFSIGGIPLWCNQLMASCPFLFSLETRCKYFKLAAYGQPQIQPHLSSNNSGTVSDKQLSLGKLPRKKFLVIRNRILESASQMMDLHAGHKVALEVKYDGEVGTGLGPTLEFYTLVCQEFKKSGLGMWREDTCSFTLMTDLQAEETRIHSLHGLFPRPWLSMQDTSGGIQFCEVTKKFVLLGQVVAKALQDGRVLDLHFSKAFYKLILGKELSLYDIQSFDPKLGRVLQEFQALVNRKKFLESVCRENSMSECGLSFRDTRIEDLYLDFTLPGYPDIILASGPNHSVVNMGNLEDYVSLVTDTTVRSGISRQVEAFKSGFNQVFNIEHLHIFTEEELEHILCGEQDSWAFNELKDNIKFDHGYTARSPPIVNFLEIIREFDHEQRRAFLQFVTGSPRLPPGGLASLNPKLTVVRKRTSNRVDTDLPSVMTCANYLKLPPYSSKERMKEKLLYAITEGQGSFHLS